VPIRVCVARSGPASSSTVAEALDAAPADVLVDYTSASAVKDNVLAAVDRRVAVVIGSSGLSAADYEEVDRRARAQEVGVIAAGNFSITAALLLRFAPKRRATSEAGR
jgi:4-hydroxy-tetrahydrodipicolinate reductase